MIGGVSWLPLLGDNSVPGAGLQVVFGDQEDTPTIVGYMSPRTRLQCARGYRPFQSSFAFSGKVTWVRRTDSTTDGLSTRGWSAHRGSRVCS